MFNNPFSKLRREGDMTDMEVTEHQEEKRSTGKIIKLSKEGWGFISSKEIPFTRIFFHWSSLKQNTKNFADLKVGMKVEFTPAPAQDGKGTRAIKIMVMESEPKAE